MLNRKPAALARDECPDSQPRRVRWGRRGLLGFLDDLRTRVKPTRGVLDLPATTSSGTDDSAGKSEIVADAGRLRHFLRPRLLDGGPASSVRPARFQWGAAENMGS